MLEEVGRLETAYIELKDCREGQTKPLEASQIKNRLSSNSVKQSAGNQHNRILKVQFNPASLTFTAGNQADISEKKSLIKKQNGFADECNITDDYKPMRLRMKLIFDRSIYKDFSVIPEVEGFLAIVKNPYIRQVGFHWGEQHYTGKISEMNVDYTMFHASGIPVRAVIDFCMDVY